MKRFQPNRFHEQAVNAEINFIFIYISVVLVDALIESCIQGPVLTTGCLINTI